MKFLTKLFIKSLGLLPKKYIILESEPDYCDNTFSLYNYIKNNKLDTRYKLIWIVDNKRKVNNSIKTFVKGSSFISKLQYIYYNIRSPLIIYCNKRIPKFYNGQKTFFLSHGSAVKNVTGKYDMPPDLDYCLVQSKYLEQPLKLAISLTDHTKLVTLGFPRNDDLLLENSFDKKDLFNVDFDKMVVWYPTFRQHKNVKTRNVSSITLPIIYSKEEAKKISEYAKQHNILIVLKPHFIQDTSYIEDLNLSNIIIINDDFLKEKNIRSYQLLNLSDALITDYSSVYYDYLLTDKPIGLTWDDYNEYSQNELFAVDMNVMFAGGEKIYNSDDFCVFLKNLSEGNDTLKEKRNKIKDLTNEYQDTNSSKRVADFIVNTLLKN